MSFRGLLPKKVFEIPSDSNPTRAYMITKWDDNESITCTCPSFVMSPKQRGLDILDRSCKHTDRVRESDQIREPLTVPPSPRPLTASDRLAAALQKQKTDKIREIELLDPRVRALIEHMAGK